MELMTSSSCPRHRFVHFCFIFNPITAESTCIQFCNGPHVPTNTTFFIIGWLTDYALFNPCNEPDTTLSYKPEKGVRKAKLAEVAAAIKKSRPEN